MSPEQQDAYLARLETGGKDLGGVPSKVFFEHLRECTIEGFFSDPVYGGNRDMVAWRMIGFPGAYASYYDLVDQHGIKIDRAPMSIGEGPHGGIHVDPGIPAQAALEGNQGEQVIVAQRFKTRGCRYDRCGLDGFPDGIGTSQGRD